ncbi:hypothetical protein BRC81_14535 [Halobacteriales archaeon QS_1_68_20]|nr:MAG: hypothetical protein BRC81_14535 [Halobacteriales archaeon QS_1_68_20]
MVDPDKPIDRKDKPSDLDVFVVISDWDLPIADPSIVLSSSEAPDPPTIREESGDSDDFELHNSEFWEDADQAWEKLPAFAQQTLVNSTRNFLRFKPEDKQENVVRNYDLRIGRREHVVELYPSACLVHEF